LICVLFSPPLPLRCPLPPLTPLGLGTPGPPVECILVLLTVFCKNGLRTFFVLCFSPYLSRFVFIYFVFLKIVLHAHLHAPPPPFLAFVPRPLNFIFSSCVLLFTEDPTFSGLWLLCTSPALVFHQTPHVEFFTFSRVSRSFPFPMRSVGITVCAVVLTV